MSIKRDNKYWGRTLANDYKNETGCIRQIRLPDAAHIKFDGEEEHVTVTMEEPAIIANLQTNAAAFEAWSLALHVWSKVRKINLVWKPPGKGCTDEGRRHYQRFLYRVERFHELFPLWFLVARPELLNDAEALGDGRLLLNVARDRRDHLPNDGGALEAVLESKLLGSEEFKEHFALRDGVLDRQFPVGLFRGAVAHKKRIFPGGKAAIDIVAIEKGVLWLFELKAGGNIPAGILSELLFYASVMRDAIGRNPPFAFLDTRTAARTTVHPQDIQGCSRIEAVLLGEKLHPLIGHAKLIRCLNEAAIRSWNVSKDRVPVNFSGATLTRSGADYSFANL